MSCGEKHPETESPDLKMTSEEWQVPMKRLKSTCIKTGASNLQFVCDMKTRHDRNIVRFDCLEWIHQRHVEDVKKRKKKDRSGLKVDTEERKDPNLVGDFAKHFS